jgi:hypothetical protein
MRYCKRMVGARTADELLMCDRYGKTRSWFRVVPLTAGGTLLQFGSAVASRRRADCTSGLTAAFRLLLGAHTIYSRLLIGAAKKRVLSSRR